MPDQPELTDGGCKHNQAHISATEVPFDRVAQLLAELANEREKVRVLREALQVIQADATLTIGEPVPMGRLAAKLICCESTARQAMTAAEPKEKP